MNAGHKPFIITMVVIGLLGLSTPPSAAGSQAMQLGVLAQGLDLSSRDLSPGTSVHAMSLDSFSSKTLDRMDGLVIGPSEAAAITGDAALKARLREYIMSGHPVFFVETAGDVIASLELPVHGADDALVGDGAESETLSGYAITDDGVTHTYTYSFESGSSLKGKALGKASQVMAAMKTPIPKELSGKKKSDSGSGSISTMSTTSSSAWWDTRATASFCAERNPWGELCYTAFFHRLEGDASPEYTWWNVFMTTSALPGYAAWGNSWFTNRMWTTSDTDGHRSTNKLVDFGPGNAYDLTSLSYSIGLTNGVEGARETNKQSNSYSLVKVRAVQGTSLTHNDFAIRHELDYASTNTMNTYNAKSGYTVRVPEGGSLKLPFSNRAEFWDYSTNSFGTITINSWREIW